LKKSDDAALFERWLTRKDGDAFAELARRHAPVVYDLASRALGDRTAAEDVVQEALLDLALEPTRKPAEVGVVAWLARFAICRARNQRSSERCRARRQLIVGLRRPEEAMPDDHLERTEELERALAAAEPDERTVLAMRFLHGWEYDRIAQALETTEGAARVRVHRALSNVRGRLGVADEAKVARGMASLALIPLPAAKLDGVIRAALDAAGVPAASAMGASRLPAAVRAGLQAFGAAVLLAGAASTSPPLADSGANVADGVTAQVVVENSAGGARASAAGFAVGANPASDVAVPRPADWDDGALARLARGETAPASDAPPPSTDAAPAAPKDAAAPPAAPPAPAAAPAAREDQPPSAFRPSARGASAANCDPGSSDDERADALGGFFRAPVQEPVAERPPVDAAPPAAEEPAAEPVVHRRVIVRGRQFDELDASERVVVEQAAALVRDVVAKVAPDAVLSADSEAVRHARRTGARAVKRQVREWRNRTSAGGTQLSPRRAAKLQRILAVLLQYALADGGAEGVRWPDGVDVASALQDLMRVLAAPPADPSAATAPAAPGAAGGTAPDGALPDGAAPVALPDGR
jgi:RNA polymerase sigma-70 factor (ECF subfamily)